jgi:riboflavin kinase/FMN adenylyltransferase
VDVIRHLRDMPRLENSAITVGNFDGVHVGHRDVLARTVQRATELGGRPLAVTFVPHPVRVVAPGREPARLTPIELKLELMAQSGLDLTLVLHFDKRLAAMPPEQFARDVLHRATGARLIVVGRGFRFGLGRAGDVTLLRQFGRELGFEVEPVEPVELDGQPVSSSRIRLALVEGRVDAAARLLGRPHQVTGVVVRGDGRGRTIGFPTANLGGLRALLPGTGVYACWARVKGERLMAAVNIGDRPTFGRGRSVEAFMLDFTGDLYGSEVTLSFASRLRSPERFSSVDDLVARIEKDVELTREVLETLPTGSATTGFVPPPSHEAGARIARPSVDGHETGDT